MKAEIISKLEELVNENMQEEVFSKADELKNSYLKECEKVNQDLLKAFIDEGGIEDNFEAPKDPQDDRFNELLLLLNDKAQSLENNDEEDATPVEIKVETISEVKVATPKESKVETNSEVEVATPVEGTVETISKEEVAKPDLSKVEIISKLEDLVKENINEEIFSKADELKNSYLKECEKVNQDLLQVFLNEGGNADSFEAPKDPNDDRFNELLHILFDREKMLKKMKGDEIQSRIKAKEAVISALEKLIAEETNIGKAFSQFNELQSKWNEIGNVPNREYKNIQSIYHRHVHNFYYNMKLSKDLRELDFKRNLEHRNQLLNKIGALLQIESINGIERMISLYRMEWSELGPTPPETIDDLRKRYRELIGQVFQKIRDHYQERQKEELVNLETKRALLVRAQGIAAENFDKPKQWQTMTDTLNGIFEEWKKIGYGPKKENDKIWHDFRNELNTFYGKKREFFNAIKKTHRENKDKKSAIIEKAEAVAAAENANWDESTKLILQLQKDWKDAGHVEPWEENKLWKKFRDACDKFFNSKRDQFKSRDSEQISNLEKKEELVKRVEAFQASGNADEDIKTLRSFSDEWKAISHVPFKEKQRIWERFKTALDAKYDGIKMESKDRHMHKFRNNVEMLSRSDESGNHMRKEQNLIKDKIHKLQAMINQYENNLGFFRNSKNMGGLLAEVESNLNNAKEELKMLQQKLKMFTEVQ